MTFPAGGEWTYLAISGWQITLLLVLGRLVQRLAEAGPRSVSPRCSSRFKVMLMQSYVGADFRAPAVIAFISPSCPVCEATSVWLDELRHDEPWLTRVIVDLSATSEADGLPRLDESGAVRMSGKLAERLGATLFVIGTPTIYGLYQSGLIQWPEAARSRRALQRSVRTLLNDA